MKTLILLIFIIFPSLAFCQNQESTYKYCLVKINGRALSHAVQIEVDYGQEQRGNPRTFNSVAQALNYMASLGWKVIQVFTTNSGPSVQMGYQYLMESRKQLNN